MAQNFSRKTTLKKKVVLEGNCNSLQLQIVAVMSKTLRRGVYQCDFFPFVSFQLVDRNPVLNASESR